MNTRFIKPFQAPGKSSFSSMGWLTHLHHTCQDGRK
jgi:hypothetical protein